jgi:hypothetical protein
MVIWVVFFDNSVPYTYWKKSAKMPTMQCLTMHIVEVEVATHYTLCTVNFNVFSYKSYAMYVVRSEDPRTEVPNMYTVYYSQYCIGPTMAA